MATNEQIIEAALRFCPPRRACDIVHTHNIFNNQDYYRVTLAEDTVELPLNWQELMENSVQASLEHDHADCDECDALEIEAREAGKSSAEALQPFDVDARMASIAYAAFSEAQRQSLSYEQSMLSALRVVAERFAAPERKPWALNDKQSIALYEHIMETINKDPMRRFNYDLLRDTINEVIGLQPTPVEERCPNCDHVNGVTKKQGWQCGFVWGNGFSHCGCIHIFHRERGESNG